ncbi:putative glutamine amidotransferase [Lachnospiraceae bacterium TWA4]|nr:putative glutamine amidotransferase [Lachnospiraceae bacterium TWA4]
MCQLFGISSKENVELNEYLKEFYSHSNEHPHGWGLAFMDHNHVSIEKEPMQASKSKYLKERLSTPIASSMAFAHIRYATIGNIKYANCHPFTLRDKTGRQWVQIHNGTIFDFKPLSKYVKVQEGDSDSERVLRYIVDQMNKAQEIKPLDAKGRFELLDQIVCSMSLGN